MCQFERGMKVQEVPQFLQPERTGRVSTSSSILWTTVRPVQWKALTYILSILLPHFPNASTQTEREPSVEDDSSLETADSPESRRWCSMPSLVESGLAATKEELGVEDV